MSETPRFVGFWDGVGDDGTPTVAADHPRLDGERRDRLVDYLRTGELVLASTELGVDHLGDGREPRVPQSFRTDGNWVWHDEIAYYLEHYGLSPETDFVQAVVARAFTRPALDDAALRRALEVVLA